MSDTKKTNTSFLLKPTPFFIIAGFLAFYFFFLAPPVHRGDYTFLAFDNIFVGFFYLIVLLIDRGLLHFAKTNITKLALIELFILLLLTPVFLDLFLSYS